jgi:predicted PurR-regulated permease PerM
MLPTPVASLNVISLFIMVIITFAIFLLTSYITSFFVLKDKTTELMKLNNTDKINIIARYTKKIANKFSVVVKFRIAVAFSSI